EHADRLGRLVDRWQTRQPERRAMAGFVDRAAPAVRRGASVERAHVDAAARRAELAAGTVVARYLAPALRLGRRVEHARERARLVPARDDDWPAASDEHHESERTHRSPRMRIACPREPRGFAIAPHARLRKRQKLAAGSAGDRESDARRAGKFIRSDRSARTR